MANLKGWDTAFARPTSEEGTSVQTTDLGTRGRDADGNEYVYVDFQQAVGTGSWCTYTGAFLASAMTSGARGPVGIAVTPTSSSDTFGWLLIYGSYSDALLVDGTSGGTSSAHLSVQTSESTPAGAAALVSDASTAANRIFGAWPTAAPATDVTAAASHTGTDVAVQLNYPYVLGYNTDSTS